MKLSRFAPFLLLAAAASFSGCKTRPASAVHQRITVTKGDRLEGSRLTGEHVDIAPLLPLMLGAKRVDSWVLWKDQQSVRLEDGRVVHFAKSDGARFRIDGEEGTFEVTGRDEAARFQTLVQSVFTAAAR